MNKIFIDTKEASYSLALLPDERKNEILNILADRIIEEKDSLLQANAKDLERMDRENPLYDRLLLTEKRLEDIAADMRHVALLPSPLNKVTNERTLQNGLYIRRISVPFGVIGVIYEARPNVSFDVFSLCFKSGNACVLKGGHDAENSNVEIVSLIKKVLSESGVNTDVVNLLPATHEATAEMLNAVGYIDLCIPRGGKKLIQFVRDNARIPVIETGAGVVHIYFDKDGDLEKGRAIINNAKTRRVSVCNALDCLIIHSSRLNDLKELASPMMGIVEPYADSRAAAFLNVATLCDDEDESVFGQEWMDYKIGVKTVDSLLKRLSHIFGNTALDTLRASLQRILKQQRFSRRTLMLLASMSMLLLRSPMVHNSDLVQR